MDWRHRAICKDEDPEAWFPLGDNNSYVKDSAAYLKAAEEPKAICSACPVASDCLEWAQETGQDYGIFGGLTAYERRALRKPRPRVTQPAPTRGRRRSNA